MYAQELEFPAVKLGVLSPPCCMHTYLWMSVHARAHGLGECVVSVFL